MATNNNQDRDMKTGNAGGSNPPATTKISKPSPQYHTRYGLVTAAAAAYDLLDRSWPRLCFLEEAFSMARNDGDGFTLPGYTSLGLAAILEDIAIDVYAANAYYAGDDPEPGKIGDVVEVES